MSFKDVRNRILDEYKMLFSAESMLKVCLSRSSRLWRTITSKSLANYVLRNKLRYCPVFILNLILTIPVKLKIYNNNIYIHHHKISMKISTPKADKCGLIVAASRPL